MSSNPSSSHRIWLAAILLVVFGVYARSLANEFTYDDRHYVMSPSDSGMRNEMVREWQGLGRYLTSYYGATAVPVGRGYRPTTVMSFALVNAVIPPADNEAPTGPVAQRITNILLHVLATWLVAAVVWRLFTSPWPGIVAAATFGLHALRSDPVISIVGRAEVLKFVFGAVGLLCYLNALERHGRACLLWSGLGGLSLFLAFGAKESGVAWAVFVPLFAAVYRGPIANPGIPRIRPLPFAVTVVVPLIAFLALWYQVFAVREFFVDPVNNPLRMADMATRFCTAVMVLGCGLWQGIAPFWLHIDYGFNSLPLASGWLDTRFLLAFVVLGALLLGGLLALRRAPALFLGMAMFFGFAFLTSNLVVLVETIYGERLMYTPIAGLSFVAAWCTSWLQQGRAGTRRAVLVLFAIWSVASGAMIVWRCGIWHDSQTLFAHAAATQPNSQRMQMAAGRQYRIEGQAIKFAGPRGQECMRQWENHLQRALAAHSDQNQPQPLNDLAYMHLIRRDLALAAQNAVEVEREEKIAESLIERALASPRFIRINGGTLYYLRSRIHGRRGERDKQLSDLIRSRDADPADPERHLRLARLHGAVGNRSECTLTLREAMQRFPDELSVRLQAIDLTDLTGDRTSFEEFLNEAGQQATGHPHLLIFRGISLSHGGSHREALDLMQRALPLAQPPLPSQTWITIATSLAALGDNVQALRVLEQHLNDPALAPSTRNAMSILRQQLSKEP